MEDGAAEADVIAPRPDSAPRPARPRPARSGQRGTRRGTRRTTTPPRLLIALWALVALPIVASAAVTLARGWVPVGDEAALALRAHDVLHGSPPLVGLPTPAAAEQPGDHLAHPGPIEAWLGAIPVAIAGPSGLVVLVAAVNAGALVLAVSVGWRRGGTGLAVAITGASVTLCWALGRAVIADPLPSRAGLIVWFAVVLLAWETWSGRWRSLPPTVALAAWCVSVHLVYLPMALVLGVGCGVLGWNDHRRAGGDRRAQRGRDRRPALLAAGAIAAVVALPALVDQVDDSGNLSQIARSAGRSGLGLRSGVTALITALGLPPAWLRGHPDPFVLLRSADALDIVASAALVGAGAWLAARAHGRGDHTTVGLMATVAAAALGGVVAVTRTPSDGAVLALDAMAVWTTLAVLAWLAVGWAAWLEVAPALARSVERRGVRSTPAPAVAALAIALGAVVVIVTAPPRTESPGRALADPATSLEASTIAALSGRRSVQVNAIGTAATSYLRPALVERLERAGISTRVPDDPRLGRSGTHGAAPQATVWVVSDPVRTAPPVSGTEVIAEADLIPGGPLSQAAERRRSLRNLIDQAGQVQLAGTADLDLTTVERSAFTGAAALPPTTAAIPAPAIAIDAVVDLARAGLLVSPTLPSDVVDQIAADRRGCTECGDDTTATIYVRTS